MTTSLMPSGPAVHPQPITEREQNALAGEIRTALLATPCAGDKKISERKRDLRKQFNRAPDTLAQFLVHSYNEGRPISRRLVEAIGGFFSARAGHTRRNIRALMAVETLREGEFNNVQMRVAQGDLSTPTLYQMKREISDYRAILDELDAAIDAQLFAPDHQ